MSLHPEDKRPVPIVGLTFKRPEFGEWLLKRLATDPPLADWQGRALPHKTRYHPKLQLAASYSAKENTVRYQIAFADDQWIHSDGLVEGNFCLSL